MEIIPWIIWFIGYTLSIHPIYASLCKSHLDNINPEGYSSNTKLKRSDVYLGMLGASLLGIGWVFAIPYMLSHMVHRHGRPDAVKEIEIFSEEQRYERELKSRVAKARKEIEASLEDDEVIAPGLSATPRPSDYAIRRYDGRIR